MTAQQADKRSAARPLVLRLLFAIPLLGWMLREAAEGGGNAKALFAVNCVLIWILAIAVFGYPAIILPALFFVLVIFCLLITITRG